MKQLFILFLAHFFFTSCTRTASLTVLQPAQFKVPEHISVVALVDRSKPSNGWLNALEGLITGEAIFQDRQSRQQAVAGLTEALSRTPRFQIKSTGIEMPGSKAGVNLPGPLSWNEVEKICADYGADAVVAIESFDSDNFAAANKVETKRKDKNGKEYIDISYNSEQRTSVRMGWRMYDPRSKIILDEIVTNNYLQHNNSGKTEREALANLPQAIYVTRDVAFLSGQSYGARIAPVYVSVSRSYYKKAKGFETQMAKALRQAQSTDWQAAGQTWQQIAGHAGTTNAKAAGRALYNAAVAAEFSGDLDAALDLAKQAYTRYGNKKARAYIRTIEQRQNDARKVETQLNKKV